MMVQAEEAPTPTWYVTNGLILHWDGINNTGEGHDSNCTSWKDLTGNGHDLTMSTTTAEVGTDYVLPKRRMSSAVGVERGGYSHVEIVFDSWLGGSSGVIHGQGNRSGTVWVGSGMVVYTFAGSSGYYGIGTNAGADSSNGIINAVSIACGSTPSIVFLNGVEKGSADFTYSTGTWGTYPGGGYWFGYTSATSSVFNHKIKSLRIYNRVLTKAEVLQNWQIDKARFNL